MNERGTESVLNADATGNLGRGMIDALNAGIDPESLFTPAITLPAYAPSVATSGGASAFRAALRDSATHADAIEIGMVVIRELERTRDWLREQGLPAPKWEVHPSKAHAKGWFGATEGPRVIRGILP